ncbi:MAG: YHS domain-containing protein [Calditrichaeota bacterium]|nr:MAG: YHS domain-containing protein [Calditrichota bacterium]
MNNELINKIIELKDSGEPFVLATVVRCEKPTSAKPGAKAIIDKEGHVTGWIGGSCAEPIVVREALKALKDGTPKLLKISNQEVSEYGKKEGVVNFEMTCFSGGTMEIFIDPVLTKARMFVVGSSPDVVALAKLAQLMEYQVIVMDPEFDHESESETLIIKKEIDFSTMEDARRACIIIGSHGRYDEEAVEKALKTDAAYIGLIASKKRASAIFDFLKKKKIPKEQIKRVKAPAGLDIGAQTPEEIAVSIMAEIIELQRTQKSVDEKVEIKTEPQATPEQALDPVCGMTVDIATARYKTDYLGVQYYFCCAGCLQKFEQEPSRYAVGGLA